MKRTLVALLVLLTGCSAVSSAFSPGPVDPKPAANLVNVQRLVAKDPDPADIAPNAQAVETAREIATGNTKSTLENVVTAVGTAATSTGTPWGIVLGGLASAGVTVLTYLHNKNANKLADHATALAALGAAPKA